ncbi:MAG TPA: Rrf2 family transcriptional regulator [Kofleriaceae bacterium]|jgi:DNA-binding IscR family transcriptional regulator
MRRDGRLSLALHALLHFAQSDGALTSEALAVGMRTNPVVIRRTMAGLREAGIVASEKGHGGGWTLVRALDAITLGDVYAALGIASALALGNRTESPGCLVEQAVNRATSAAFAEAEAVLAQRLHAVTLAELAADVRGRAHKHHRKGNVHA